MNWGLENRLSRIIQKDGRALMFAVDHGYFLGAIAGLEKPRKMLKGVTPHSDAVMLTRGMLTQLSPQTGKPIILRADGGPSIAGDKLGVSTLADHEIMITIEDALRLNASAVAISVFVGTEYETQTMRNLSAMVNEAKKYGLPVLAVTAVGRKLDELKDDPKYLGLACRMSAEHGADIVKTYYCTNGFEEVTGGCFVPVVMAGGKAGDGPMAALEQAHNAVSKGAIGVDMGRNIFQSENPIGMIKAVKSVVHGRLSPTEAHEKYFKG
ncbi:MAG: 3-hydroxy-5-phosphonooxypentane-2,4-dione thiolase [Candidatus Woesearchaeota archaeon]